MANRHLFSTSPGRLTPTTATNAAGGIAYAFSAEHALAQYVLTGCLHHTFYTDADTQLETTLALSREVEPAFMAQLAVYARERGFMKDMPALLCAVLASRDVAYCQRIFTRVIDDMRMLRTFCQILRSGATGRKSFGTAVKRLIQRWLLAQTPEQLFRSSIGQAPSVADILRMVHPHPPTAGHDAMFGYLLGQCGEEKQADLPQIVRDFEAFKATQDGPLPAVPFFLLTALPLTPEHWKTIARRATWQQTRMNLNTFARHGVFDDPGIVEEVAARLRNPEAIRQARVFPYQLLAASMHGRGDLPHAITTALQEAMEVATRNVPALEGKLFIFPDVSGSMSSAVTGHRKGSTSQVRCIDVAGLITATLLRQNPGAEVLPFDTRVHDVFLSGDTSVMTNAATLGALHGGGTACSVPLEKLNAERRHGDVLLYISDNESWVDSRPGHRGTAVLAQWRIFQERNPHARLVCIDIQPSGTTQVLDDRHVLNVGGFSDAVFDVVAHFLRGESDKRLTDVIRAVSIEVPECSTGLHSSCHVLSSPCRVPK